MGLVIHGPVFVRGPVDAGLQVDVPDEPRQAGPPGQLRGLHLGPDPLRILAELRQHVGDPLLQPLQADGPRRQQDVPSDVAQARGPTRGREYLLDQVPRRLGPALEGPEEEPIGILVLGEPRGRIARATAQHHHRPELIGAPVSLGVQDRSEPAYFLGQGPNAEGGLPQRGQDVRRVVGDRQLFPELRHAGITLVMPGRGGRLDLLGELVLAGTLNPVSEPMGAETLLGQEFLHHGPRPVVRKPPVPQRQVLQRIFAVKVVHQGVTAVLQTVTRRDEFSCIRFRASGLGAIPPGDLPALFDADNHGEAFKGQKP